MAEHLVALAPAALPPIRVLTSWPLQPGVLAAFPALGGGYGVGLRLRARAGLVWPPMLRVYEGRAAAVDAELDAAEQHAKARAEQAVDGTDEGSPRPRLWWEDDPRIAQRFRRRQ